MSCMADPTQIPQLASELYELSKEYLRQETIEPAKRLGRHAGLGLAGAFAFAVAAILGTLGLYELLQVVLPASEWYNVLARGLTTLAAAAVAGLVAWRMSS